MQNLQAKSLRGLQGLLVSSWSASNLTADIEEGHKSATLPHLANIAYTLQRSVKFDPETETFDDDQQANVLLTRGYRKPYLLPDQV